MENQINKNQDAQPIPTVETDVLGLRKDTGLRPTSKAKPNIIFIVLAILAAIAGIYWWTNM